MNVENDKALYGLLVVVFMLVGTIYNSLDPTRRANRRWGNGSFSRPLSELSSSLFIVVVGTLGIWQFCKVFGYQWNETLGFRILGGAFALLIISMVRDCNQPE